MTRTIELELPEELLSLLDAKARSAGIERGAYICAVLSNEVIGEPSINQVLAPFREQVRDSGISDEEQGRLFSDARDESHRARSR